jgi:hypothetical protein
MREVSMSNALTVLCAFAAGVLAVLAVRTGQPAPLAAFAAFATALLAMLAWPRIKDAFVRMTACCQLCEKPFTPEERRAAGDFALKYGVRACARCGAKLDEHFGDDGNPRDPPSLPPAMR